MTQVPERSHAAARFFSCGNSQVAASSRMSETHQWLHKVTERQQLKVSRVPFSAMDRWGFRPEDGSLAHDSGMFFSVQGIHVRTDSAWRPDWIQPIIVQPEVGFLGLIVKEFHGTLHLLVQAKTEPGNINTVQISPTVQATRSNYTGVHRGSRVRFFEYFDGTRPVRTLVDVLQSEQGAWFFHKRNRNVIVEVFDDIPEHENFRWMTLKQLRTLLHLDNVVNMDLRTILSCIPTVLGRTDAERLLGTVPEGSFAYRLLHSFIGMGNPQLNMSSILSWITDIRSRRECVQRVVPLHHIDRYGWVRTDHSIMHEEKKYFEIFGAEIRTSDREVKSWMQPLLSPTSTGLLALLVKQINGTVHALVQMRVEAGCLNIAELAPTVHCQPANYADAPPEHQPPYLDYVLTLPRTRIRYDSLQSEEGGRFHHAENRYMLAEVTDDFPDEHRAGYRWMTFGQITSLLEHSHYVNMQLRSLVACAAACTTPPG
ncbi:NDP-hexose 2,3-dehydratase family protein [Streptomyces noursei]|uniref:NDP-hexose 2,3-dehydratase family protein n=1 Tax=Streptomyces noursei TaxID=1971 RepID=UPI0033C81B3B